MMLYEFVEKTNKPTGRSIEVRCSRKTGKPTEAALKKAVLTLADTSGHVNTPCTSVVYGDPMKRCVLRKRLDGDPKQ